MIFTPFAFMAETAAPGAWSPADIAKYWWTADAGVTESGGAVSAWVDQVNSLSIDQASSTLQPTLVTSTNLNSQNAIRFDGSDDYLQRSPISFASDGYAFSCITIAYNNGGSGNASLVAQSFLGPADDRFALLVNSSNLQYINQGFSSTNPISIESPATNGVKVSAFEYDAAGNVRTWFNNLNTPSSYSGGDTNNDIIQTTSLIFGAYNNTSTGVAAGFRWDGDLAEVIFVPSTLSAGDITNLQTYINTKYNLSV